MKVIIAGPRDFLVFIAEVDRAVKASGFHVSEVVSGQSAGVDRAGEIWAIRTMTPLHYFPVNWAKGHRAGPDRNEQMADYADALIVIRRFGQLTRGTLDMLKKADAASIPHYIHEVRT